MSDMKFPFTPRPWSTELFKLMSSTSFRALVLIVHRRAGKSWMGCAAIVMAALHTPGRYGIVGPQLKTMKAIFWPLLRHFLGDIVPKDNFRVGDLTVTVPCAGGGESLISIHSAGDADQGSNIRGLQFQGLFVDEADQIGTESFWGELWPTQTNLDKPWIVVSGTPRGDMLLADLLRQADRTDGWHGSQLGVYDTKVLAQSEIDLTEAQMPPNQFAREMLARTDVGTEDQIIKIEHVLSCLNRTVGEFERRDIVQSYPLVMGVDIGRLNDETVMALRQGPVVYEFIRMKGATTQEIALRALNICRERRVDALFVDAGSMGISFIDVMQQLGLNPVAINFGGSATDGERYGNKRAEMFDRVRAWTEKANSALPDQKGDTHLQKELTAPLFKLNASNKLQIEPKDAIKKRLGHSTDALDALALTFAASPATASMPSHHYLGNPAEMRARETDARIEKGADGSRYSSARRTALHRQRTQPEQFVPYDDSDAFDPYAETDQGGHEPDLTSPFPRGRRIGW